MITKLLTIARLVNGDDVRSFHRYSFRSSNFTFFISKTILFRFVVHSMRRLWELRVGVCAVCVRWMQPPDRLFNIYSFYCYCSSVQLVCYYMCIQFGWAPVSHCITFTKHLNCTNLALNIFFFFLLFILLYSTIAYRVTIESKIYIRFCFVSREFSLSLALRVSVIYLLLFSNWIVFVFYFFVHFVVFLYSTIQPVSGSSLFTFFLFSLLIFDLDVYDYSLQQISFVWIISLFLCLSFPFCFWFIALLFHLQVHNAHSTFNSTEKSNFTHKWTTKALLQRNFILLLIRWILELFSFFFFLFFLRTNKRFIRRF